MDEKDAAFLHWLKSEGAQFPSIEWPTSETVSGIRGAVAKQNIDTNEHMIEIPKHLMISPPIIFADNDIGEPLRASMDLMGGDLAPCIYIMHEMLKKEDSFYYPFLRILPDPGNISEWSEEELRMLQDDRMALMAKRRRLQIKHYYKKSVVELNRRFPDTFPLAAYSEELFSFAWNTVQARAFGRRLPWTALVPFADCLNHTNVQTKYDYDIDGNGMFRLFPTGSNSYGKGCEVFNSYGRRPNDNLLLDYGFTILDNEWEQVAVTLGINDDDYYFRSKQMALYSLGYNRHRIFYLSQENILPIEMLSYLRVLCLNGDQLQAVETMEDQKADGQVLIFSKALLQASTAEGEQKVAKQAKPPCEIYDFPRRKPTNYYDHIISLKNEYDALRMLLQILQSHLSFSSSSSIRSSTRSFASPLSSSSPPTRTSPSSSPPSEQAPPSSSPPWLSNGPTSLEEDLILLGQLERLKDVSIASATTEAAIETLAPLPTFDTAEYWRLVSSVNYRITRKHILTKSIAFVQALIEWFEQDIPMKKGDWNSPVLEIIHRLSGPRHAEYLLDLKCPEKWPLQ